MDMPGKAEGQQHATPNEPAPQAGVDTLSQIQPRYRPHWAYAQAGLGLLSYLTCVLLICNLGVGDPAVEAEYHQQVHPATYQWPMVAFGTAFMLNLITLVFERESSKNQLALLACYINLLAGINDFLAWLGVLPIRMDAWGRGQQLGRMVMWLHTTPTMVYLLGMISNFSAQEVVLAMGVDVFMTVCGVAAQMTDSGLAAALLYIMLTCSFAYIVRQMWRMFDSALADAQTDASATSIKILRMFTVGLWFLFPAIFVVVQTGFVSIPAEEWLWTVGDFLGKVMFSSSLLQGNFLTMDQRKYLTRRIVEEANRVQMIEELRELVEYKERFMSGMSHELRTPLNGIIGLSEAVLVGSCGEISEACTKTINTIKNSGARLLNLINDILDAASMKQRKGKLTIKQEKVSLKRVVEDVLELCQPLARRGVKLVNAVPSNLPPVVGDTGRLIQIFHNLVGNACKFTHAGTISIGGTYKVDEVEVSVADTGIGIPEDKLSSIFQAFEQVDTNTTRKYGGTGLGLNLVKQLVEAHGTSVVVKSKVGLGTSFYFTLKIWEGKSEGPTDPPSPSRRSMSGTPADLHRPSAKKVPSGRGLLDTIGSSGSRVGASITSNDSVAHTARPLSRLSGPQPSITEDTKPEGITKRPLTDASRVAAASRAAAAAVSTSNPRASMDVKDVFMPLSVGAKVEVLSVDDDPVNQMVIQNLLAPAGYTITQAMDGMEALETLNSMGHLPDIILLDVMMPGMSGYEVCRTLREQYPNSCVPIIMISAKSKEEDIVEGLASGANDYVVKPFGRTEILARIATHLRFTRADLMSSAKDISTSGNNAKAKAVSSNPSATADQQQLSQLMAARSSAPSLPAPVRTKIQNGQQASTTFMFDQLTLVAWKFVNLEDLQGKVAAEELAVALASLHERVDALLESCGKMYMPSAAEQDCYMAVAGLEHPEQQAERALQFASGLLEAAAAVKLPGSHHLHISVGVHSMAAQAVVVGTSRPAMHVIGQLMNVTCQLLAACAENCVHVSSKVKAAASADTAVKLSQAGTVAGEPTYLLQVGQWQESLPAMPAACARRTSASAVTNTSAVQLTPMQRSLVSLLTIDPTTMLELGLHHAAAGKASAATQLGSSVGKTGTEEVVALRHDKEVLIRQLDEVSVEAARLQDEVDLLSEQLAAAKQAAGASPHQADAAVMQQHQHRIHELEQQLAAARAELAAFRASEAKRLMTSGAGMLAHAPDGATGTGTSPRLASHTEEGGLAVAGAASNLGVSTPTGSGPSAGRAPFASRSALDSQRSSMIGSPGRLTAPLSPAAATDISVLLAEVGLQELAARFQAEQITPELVPLMDDAALKELGVVSLGARVKLRLAAQNATAGH